MLCDRWALDLAGPLPATPRGERYAVVLVEYVSKLVIAVPVSSRVTEGIAAVIMERVLFQHGPFRELLMDGAKEFQSALVKTLVELVQAKQSTPVSYQPNLMSLVERFNRTWKYVVAMYVAERQTDWDEWLPALVYAYNSAPHTVTGYAPYELMTGREPRSPRDLSLADRVEAVGTLGAWHKRLQERMRLAHEIARTAIAKEQARQARYDNRRTRREWEFRVGELVWAFQPPRGPGITKLRHPWVGPCRTIEDAGFDNWRVWRLDDRAGSAGGPVGPVQGSTVRLVWRWRGAASQ